MTEKSRYKKYLIEEDTTVSGFLSDKNSVIGEISKKDFLKFKDMNGVENSVHIFYKYSKSEQSKESNVRKFLDFNLTEIKEGTIVSIPVSQFKEELIVTGGKNLFADQSKQLTSYFVEEQKKLQQNDKYVKLESLTQVGQSVDVQTIEENCQVWIYVKSIDKLIDISPFVNSLTISKTDIGSFNINLNPIEVEIDRDSDSVVGVFVSNSNKKEYLNQYEIKTIDGKVNHSFFDKYCQQNDTVFIRFEKLKVEEDVEVNKFGSHNIEVAKQSLPDQYFDMIGLVDSVDSSVNSETTDYFVSLSGRDLMKVLVEDGAYLMDLTYARGAENTFYYLGQEDDKYFKRNFVNNGAYEYLFKEFLDPIKTYMGFIVNQLSNVGWSGDNDLFKYYTNKPEKYRIGISNEEEYLKAVEQNGVWQICHLCIDPNLSDRRVIDGSFIDQDGTLYEQFKKVCQDPFVDFWGDTYKSQFNFIARQLPFDKKGMMDVLHTDGYVISVKERDTYQINLGWETEFYSWFQFFPSNQITGDDPFFYAASFPIIYLDKYVEHFGNHRYVTHDNYVFGESVDVMQGKENKQSMAKGLFNDLKYVIESMAVLPFTRKGTVTINGDRRIKRGGFIKLEATGEICYVDGVQNSISFNRHGINRFTTLSLKRCMFEEFVGENWVQTENYGSARGFEYYDIVNTELIIEDLRKRYEDIVQDDPEEEEFENVSKAVTQTGVNFGVNEDAFNFFLERRQMDDL